jgi:hypothetical protein
MAQKSKDDVAKELAQAHAAQEPTITAIYRITSAQDGDENEPIKLLEVNEATLPSGVVPVYFGPGDGVAYPSVVVELTGSEYVKLSSGGELHLPAGWSVKTNPLFKK